jgi:hypothetical protein
MIHSTPSVVTKGRALCLAGLLALAGNAGAAEVPAEAKAAIESARAELRADREKLIAANLPLTSEQAAAFWPLYRQYSADRAKAWDLRISTILDYAAAYPEVDDSTAANLVKRSLQWNREMTRVTESYVKKFSRILPATTVMRLLQIESRIDSIVATRLQAGMPLVEPVAP